MNDPPVYWILPESDPYRLAVCLVVVGMDQVSLQQGPEIPVVAVAAVAAVTAAAAVVVAAVAAVVMVSVVEAVVAAEAAAAVSAEAAAVGWHQLVVAVAVARLAVSERLAPHPQ